MLGGGGVIERSLPYKELNNFLFYLTFDYTIRKYISGEVWLSFNLIGVQGPQSNDAEGEGSVQSSIKHLWGNPT